ncbi:MAG: nuclear transport factor 2 family protein [Pseudohaliea sp.]
MARFLNYFESFEAALHSGDWDLVGSCLAENARYTVTGVPFACEVEGRAAILRAFRKSTAAFDATMDFRLLEIQSMTRLGPGRIRAELISGYGRNATGATTAPVSVEVQADERGIVELRDSYDQELTEPALLWIAMNLGDADPSYV